ncbi:hypothetical protein [Aeromonas caviae]|uniref:hypothetical protein n=1 Tax=Aeromonas caviae TaxID=648 RepID=UPI002B4841D8|nr:hypothetical protein [Aeromonas caviae]
MDDDILKNIDTEILFLLRDITSEKRDLPHKKELIKIKSLLKRISFDESSFFKKDNPSVFGLSSNSGSEISFKKIDGGSGNYSRAEMKYVFYEATLFLSVILKALTSYYIDNKPLEDLDPKEGSRVPVELSVLIWYGNLLEDIDNQRLVHSSIGNNLIKLNQFKSEFENKKLESIRDTAGKVFMKSLAEISEIERAKFSDIVSTNANSLSAYHQSLQDNVKVELDRIRDGITRIGEIETANNSYKTKISDIYKHCETRKASIDEVFISSNKKGMAKSFQDMATELRFSIVIWLLAFVTSLLCVAYNGYELNKLINQQAQRSSIESYIKGVIEQLPKDNDTHKKLSQNADVNFDSKEDFLSIKVIIVRVLMITPFLWLAWFSGRQYSHTNKLRQDYIYKSAVAMAYQGYKAESTEMGSEMHNKLLENIVGHFSDNPVRLYEKAEPSSPLEELIKKLSPEGVAELIKALKAKA